MTAENEVYREAERHAAARLGWPVEDVVAVSHRLWGHGLSAERDARTETRSRAVPKNSRTGIRAHATRALLDELRAARP
jgi:hypothetical protein